MKCRTSSINDSDEENLDGSVLRNEIRALLNKTRGGEFSTTRKNGFGRNGLQAKEFAVSRNRKAIAVLDQGEESSLQPG
jgi:hypothetical protein